MKKIITLAALVTALSGCTTKTEHGECIGAVDDKKPNLEYKLSGWNLAMAFIFSETIVVPVVVAANSTFCPVGKK